MNRLNTYPISEGVKRKELNTIKNTLENNKYDRNKSKTQQNPKKQGTNNEPQHKKTKWATFTYSGKETKQITKLFKDTHIKIAYKTRNTIQKLTNQHTQSEKYDNGGIYQLKWLDCPLKYIGQIGRVFHTRCKEHILAIKNNNGNSGYSNTGHGHHKKTHKKTHGHTRKIPHTEIIQSHRAQQPNIQNTTRNRQQIAAQNTHTHNSTKNSISNKQ
jgi:hypothetical protein